VLADDGHDYLPTWQEKRGKSCHMTGDRFPCLAPDCKISDTNIMNQT